MQSQQSLASLTSSKDKPPKSGNAAAKVDLANEFAASDEAAYSGYDSTWNVKMPE